MKTETDFTLAYRGLSLISFGLLGFILLDYINIDPFLKFCGYWIFGAMVPALGLIDIGVSLRVWNHLADLKENKNAIGWQLAVFFATVPAAILAWFCSSWPVELVYQAVTGIYTFTGVQATAVNLVKALVGVIVGLSVFFGIIWLWVNSHRSENV